MEILEPYFVGQIVGYVDLPSDESSSPSDPDVKPFWAAAQTVTTMEHLVRRDIEKGGHGTFVPTCARFWKVDGREYAKERPVYGGYVFFLTSDDWAGIPDIHGVYRVLSSRVLDGEMKRMMVNHALGTHNETLLPRFTKYYRKPESASRRNSRKPRRSKRLSSFAVS